MAVLNEGAGRMSHQGQHRLSRRKYQELVRFLKETLTNKQVGMKVRMAAAIRLDDLYRRHEETQLELERREERKRQGQAAAGMPGAEVDRAETPAPPENPEDAAELFLERMRQRKMGKSTDE